MKTFIVLATQDHGRAVVGVRLLALAGIDFSFSHRGRCVEYVLEVSEDDAVLATEELLKILEVSI